jgi:hypothetical protein
MREVLEYLRQVPRMWNVLEYLRHPSLISGIS